MEEPVLKCQVKAIIQAQNLVLSYLWQKNKMFANFQRCLASFMDELTSRIKNNEPSILDHAHVLTEIISNR